MQSRYRFVVLAVIAAAVLCGTIMSQGFQWVWVWRAWPNPYLMGVRELALTNILGYAAASIAALTVLKNQTSATFANEAVDELAKVTWPSREETGSSTIMVVIAVLISAAFFGVFDAIWMALTDWLLGISPVA